MGVCEMSLILWEYLFVIKRTKISILKFKINSDMKYLCIFILTTISVLTGSHLLAQIENGGFEQESTGNHNGSIVGWRLDAWGGAQASFYVVKSPVVKGKKALKVKVENTNGASPRKVYVSNWQKSAFFKKAGDKIYVSFYAKADQAGNRINVDIRQKGSTKNILSSQFTLTSSYEKYLLEFSVPKDGFYGLHIGFSAASGMYWLDEVSYEKEDFFAVETNKQWDPTQQTVYVSAVKGSDQNKGNKEAPLKTIQKALKFLRSADTCIIMEGRYHEAVIASYLIGSSSQKKVIKAFPNHKVIIDGTIKIDNKWEIHEDRIYKTKLDTDVWQLFANQEMMTSARWPNAEAWSEEMWDKENTWGHQHQSSEYGKMVDDGKMNLASVTKSFEGAIAILNVGSWLSFAEKVTHHHAGTNFFNYSKNFPKGMYHKKIVEGKYFIEGSLACLDAEKEWYYNPESKELYLYAPNGQNPESMVIRGKDITYGLTLSNSEHVQIIGIDFFACTLDMQRVKHTKVEDCNFEFPSYSKRMLGELAQAAPSSVDAGTANEISCNVLRNCSFTNADGSGLVIKGKKDSVINCLFKNIDYSCVGTKDDVMVNARFASELYFAHNTLDTGGNSVGLKMGNKNKIELTRITGIGKLQNDGAGAQADAEFVDGTEMRYNWVHDTPKFGLRFDTPWNDSTKYGINGLMHYNVVWNAKALIPKGDYHTFYNNTAFNNDQIDVSIFSEMKHGGYNHHTITRNNAANVISGKNGKGITPVRGVLDHNWFGIYFEPNRDVVQQLKDPVNWDFRPADNSELIDAGITIEGVNEGYLGENPDIGAYEHGAINYWIAGRQEEKASIPVPRGVAPVDFANLELMWLKAYKSKGSEIYLGTSYEKVEKADKSSVEYIGFFENNIVKTPELESGVQYYWRVDEIKANGRVKGDIWSFMTKE
ncbi:DUF1565 domain-containing protein [Labilibacter sediminis]|nr:DUF1565 domain-containing protein [Labilibacter sediminis]